MGKVKTGENLTICFLVFSFIHSLNEKTQERNRGRETKKEGKERVGGRRKDEELR